MSVEDPPRILVDLVHWAVRAAPPAVPDLGRTKRRAATLRRRRTAAITAAAVAVLLVAAIPTVLWHRPPPDLAVVVPSAPTTPTTQVLFGLGGDVPRCADSDLSLVVVPEQPWRHRGADLKLTLKIKNVSTRACFRDLDADSWQFYLVQSRASLQGGDPPIWTSGVCDASHGNDWITLPPSFEMSYTDTWDGKATSHGCANRDIPPAGTYQLFGRLGTKRSESVLLQLT